MSLADIDAAATRRRLEEIAAGSKKAFEALSRRAAEIDRESREAAAKEEADRHAVEQRRREAKEAVPTPEPEPAVKDEPARPSRTLKLGAPQDRAEAPAPEKAPEKAPDQPEPRKTPRPAGDDDMSGRTWLR